VRPLLSAIVFFFVTLALSAVAVVGGVFDRSGDVVLKIARLWSRIVLGTAGVELRVRFHAPLDPKKPYVFMSNHLSAVDIWAMFVGVPVPFRFIAKKQLGRIPLFGWAMKAGRFIFIDRQNGASARRSIEEAASRIRNGCSVVMYPEGTRSRDGRLLPFKKGGFHLAMSSGVEIVPVAIRGTREIMPAGALFVRAGVAELELGAPIATAGVAMAGAEREALIAAVRGRIAEMLGQSADVPAASVENA
jgi:1-acyl-sn-glycerol-3-phosphate acyltransferase